MLQEKNLNTFKANFNKASKLFTHDSKGHSSKGFKCHLLILLFLAGIILLNPNETYAQGEPSPDVQFTISTSPTGGKWCPYLDIEISVTNQYSLSSTETAEYNWTFEGGTPSSYYAFVSSSTGSPTPPAVYWTEEGTFTISVIATKYDQFEQQIDQDSWEVEIIIDATCCGTLLLPIPTLSGSQTILNGIYYMSSDLTIPNGHHLIITGTVLVEGDAVPNTGPGGTVNGYFFRVEQGGTFEIYNGEVRAHCDQMWGGVEVEQDADIKILNAKFKDSFFGIHPQSLTSNPYYADISFSTFKNNRISVISKDFDGRVGKDYIGLNEFTCNSLDFLHPFMPNVGNNSGEIFISECHVRLLDGYRIEIGAFEKNLFENAINGVELISTPSTAYNPYNYINANTFKNNQKIGLYTNNREGLYIQESHIFEIPSNPDVSSWQYENYSYSNFPNVEENVVFGIYADNMLELGFLYGSLIESDLSTDLSFNGIKRAGIFLNLIPDIPNQNATHSFILESTIKEMHVGAEFAGMTDHVQINENFFIDNLVSLKFSSDPQPISAGQNAKLQFTGFQCNKFDIQNGSYDDTFIGMYVLEGCPLSNIGYKLPPQQSIPNGNGWALDPNQSPGWNNTIPSTPGPTIDVSQWHVYDNWYSIIDDNPSPNWKYARFDNELLGDFDNKVVPSSIVHVVLGNNALTTQCPTTLDIPFPQSRIINSYKKEFVDKISIYPNPVKDCTYLLEDWSEISSVGLLDLWGKKWSISEDKINKNKIDLRQFPGGLYILHLEGSNGDLKRIKILIQR